MAEEYYTMLCSTPDCPNELGWYVGAYVINRVICSPCMHSVLDGAVHLEVLE